MVELSDKIEQVATMTDADRIEALEAEMADLSARLDRLISPPLSQDTIKELATMTLQGDRFAFSRFNRLRRLDRKRRMEASGHAQPR